MAIIYGVDTEKPITEIMVRDALIRCFAQAQCPFREPGKTYTDPLDEIYARPIVEKAFSDSGYDIEHPTKESLEAAILNLIDFSQNFADPSIIQQHAQEMRQLMEKLS